MKYERYKVVHVRNRDDGRVELAGSETLVLTPDEALAMSHMAIVVGRAGIAIFEGRHMQPDVHLGWLS